VRRFTLLGICASDVAVRGNTRDNCVQPRDDQVCTGRRRPGRLRVHRRVYLPICAASTATCGESGSRPAAYIASEMPVLSPYLAITFSQDAVFTSLFVRNDDIIAAVAEDAIFMVRILIRLNYVGDSRLPVPV